MRELLFRYVLIQNPILDNMELAQTYRLIEFEKFAVRYIVGNVSNVDLSFAKTVWPLLRTNLTQDLQANFLAHHPLLQPLARSSDSLDNLVAALNQEYNQLTLAALELDTLSSNYYIASLWKSRFALKVTPAKAGMVLARDEIDMRFDGVKALGVFQEALRALRAGDPLETPVGQMFDVYRGDDLGFMSSETRQARHRRVVFAQKINILCLALGVPETFSSPRANIFALRKFLSSRPVAFPGREASLQLQVEQLTERTRWQGRVITNLMYRHLMDRLPESTSDGSASSRERWTAFFDQAMQNAQQSEGNDGQTSTHPFAAVVANSEDSAERQHITNVGQELYESISANIRSYNIEHQAASDQWDAAQLAILQALRPESYNDGGEIDWQAERRRFLTPSSTSEIPLREQHSDGPNGETSTQDEEDTRPPPYSST